ncbi:uncharacterized protein TM35_000093240 [Trypanosoma theileri]|uniref:Uncharacterized protein n=1 Tax=Trypanosoma theileri TaxID=67003 RepID=A0A1X0P002_9TRYP|nr:uncharacterized protein TM35_000093240 [Trypanosoma theileri]ORC90274.1 hypothetical protein TM35_000093240 [Trypanosoma theileri]
MFSSQFDDNPFAEEMEAEKSPIHNSETVKSNTSPANNNNNINNNNNDSSSSNNNNNNNNNNKNMKKQRSGTSSSSSSGEEEEIEEGEEDNNTTMEDEPQLKAARLESHTVCNPNNDIHTTTAYDHTAAAAAEVNPIETTTTTIATVPCIGYSVEDEDDAEDDGVDEESFNVHLSRLAELEATEKQSTHTHKFHMTLAEEKNEILRVCESRLRDAVMKLERKRNKKIQQGEVSTTTITITTTTGAAVSSSNKETETLVDEDNDNNDDPTELFTLMEVYDSATELEMLAMHARSLQYIETAQTGVKERNHHNRSLSEYEHWMPTAPLVEKDKIVQDSSIVITDEEKFKEMHSALEKLLPQLDPKLAKLIQMLIQLIQELQDKLNALCSVKNSLSSHVNILNARWSTYALWGIERSLLTAEEQMHSHLACVQPTPAEQQQFHQQRQLQKQLHRTEVAVAALLATTAGVPLRTVTPAALNHVLQRSQQLEELKEHLSREVLYLRKLLRERLTSSPLFPWPFVNNEMEGGLSFITDAGTSTSSSNNNHSNSNNNNTTEEGRLYLLQHCCAVLAKRLRMVTEKIIGTVMRNSTACSSTVEQQEQFVEYDAKANAQHSSIVTCMKENSRLQQQIKDAALIKLFAPPSSPALELLAEKLQILSRSKHLITPRDRNDDDVEGEEEEEEGGEGGEESYNYNEENEEEEDSDLQKPILSVFTEQVKILVQLFNAQLHGLENIFKDEKQLYKEIAILLRISIAADRLLLGKVGVSFPTKSSDDVAATDDNNNININIDDDTDFTLFDACKELDEVHLSLGATPFILQELPSVDELSAALQSQSNQHKKELAQQCSVAEKTHNELQEDLDWCRQQSPQTATAELCEVEKELQHLKNLLALTTAHEKETPELEAELKKEKKHLAELQRDMLELQEGMKAAEEEWSLINKRKEEEKNAHSTLVTEMHEENKKDDNSQDNTAAAADAVDDNVDNGEGDGDNFNDQDENA